jgi:hypothetical protein
MNTTFNPNVITKTIPAGEKVPVDVAGTFFVVLAATGPISIAPDGLNAFPTITGRGRVVPQFKALVLANNQTVSASVTVLVDFAPWTNAAVQSQEAETIMETWTESVNNVFNETGPPYLTPLVIEGGLQILNGILCRQKSVIIQNQSGTYTIAISDAYGGKPGDASITLAPGAPPLPIPTSDNVLIYIVPAGGGGMQSATVGIIQLFLPLFA